MKFAIVIAAAVAVSPFSAIAGNGRFDILGIKIGDGIEEVQSALAKAGARSSSTQKIPCATETNVSRRAGRCVSSIQGSIDDVTSIRVDFSEDYPARPGISVAAKIVARYEYTRESDGPRRPTFSNYRDKLIDKYGGPSDMNESYGKLIWGEAWCRKRDCPLQKEHLEFEFTHQSGFADSLELENPSLTASQQQAKRDAVENAKVLGNPKF
jgi:hypothetical protein